MVNLSQLHIINIHHLLFSVDSTMPVTIQVLVVWPPPVMNCVYFEGHIFILGVSADVLVERDLLSSECNSRGKYSNQRLLLVRQSTSNKCDKHSCNRNNREINNSRVSL